MQNRTYSKRPPGGFSLVELLIVIAVIGVIAAMSIMTMTNTTKNSGVTAAKANAQRIASVYHAGMATGAPLFATADSVDSAMNVVGTGSFGAGANKAAWFQLEGISSGMDESKPSEQQAKTYLAWENNTLIYKPGSSPGGPAPDMTGWQMIDTAGSPEEAQRRAAAANQILGDLAEYMAIGNQVWMRPRA